MLLDKKPLPRITVSLGTTFNRTRRWKKLWTRFQTPSVAPITAVTVVQLMFIPSFSQALP